MVYLLDTNVLSDAVRPTPDARVQAWLLAQSQRDLAISVMSLAEIEFGIALMAPGVRRTRFEQWARNDVARRFGDGLLHADERVARAYGPLAAAGRRAGRALPPIDGLIVATAQVHALTLVTRNVADCAGRGVPVLDPWTGTLHT